MKILPKTNHLSGQTVLIVLLIMAVILTIALSTISTSVTDIKISQETEEASRAYYVAESALEEQLLAFATAPSSTTGSMGDIDYQVTRADLGGQRELLLPSALNASQTQTVWLIDHNDDGTLKEGTSLGTGLIDVYFGSQEVTGIMPALAISLVYKDSSGNFQILRKNCDPDGARQGSNSFDNAGQVGYSISGVTLKYDCQVSVTGGKTPYLLKLALLYNTLPHLVGLKVAANEIIPRQGYCFESTAKVPPSGITRKIKQCKSWADLPEIFSWGLFSGSGIEQQQL